MDDVVVLEAPDDVQYRVALADVREELVPEPFALRRALDETGDIGELDRRAYYLLRAYDLRKRLEAGILDLDYRRVGLDRAERIVLGGCLLLLRECVEKRGLADVGEAHDAYIETHFFTSSFLTFSKPFVPGTYFQPGYMSCSSLR